MGLRRSIGFGVELGLAGDEGLQDCGLAEDEPCESDDDEDESDENHTILFFYFALFIANRGHKFSK